MLYHFAGYENLYALEALDWHEMIQLRTLDRAHLI